MKIVITAPENFRDYLNKYDKEFVILNEIETTNSSEYEVNYRDIAINATISLVISVFSPFITDVIREYVNNTKNEIIISLSDDNVSKIRINNVNEKIPTIHDNINAILKEEKYGKKRPF